MQLSINSPIMVIACICVSALTVFILSRASSFNCNENNRNVEIDGMRGYLALMVFIHHSNLWYYYIHTGNWGTTESVAYNNIGKMAVVFFFMITGFLFYKKIKLSDKINWINLYFSRITRLTPMFLFAFVLVLLIVFIKSNFSLNVTKPQFILSISRWVPFTILGMPKINDIEASRVIAGVPWSLVYEWFFYLSLPIIAFLMKKKVSVIILLLSTLSLLIFIIYPSLKIHVISFLFGFLSSEISLRLKNKKIFSNIKSSFISVIILLVTSLYVDNPYGIISIFMCGVVFILVSNGCDLFGLFKAKTSLFFGEITYSMYLIHGIVLYVMLNMIISRDYLLSISSLEYILLIGIANIAVITFSFISFKIIEQPLSKYKKIIK